MNQSAKRTNREAKAQQMLSPLDYPASQRADLIPGSNGITSPTGTETVRVLISGDHECLRASLRTMLELDPKISVVGEADDDCQTIKMARRLRPDVLLIDLDMACCDHLEAVAEIADQRLASSIVALSIHQDEVARKAALEAGADILLEKGLPYRQLVRAVRLGAVNQHTS